MSPNRAPDMLKAQFVQEGKQNAMQFHPSQLEQKFSRHAPDRKLDGLLQIFHRLTRFELVKHGICIRHIPCENLAIL